MAHFFTSDCHFWHYNIIKYCNRPFSSIHEMNETLIINWNSKVTNNDTIWILGDLFFCDEEKAFTILKQLKGRKKIVLGNHDVLLKKKKEIFQAYFEYLPDLFETNINGNNIVMCHYPMLQWNRSHYGSYMLHGHSHNKIEFDPTIKRLDVGVDAQNFSPISWDEIKNKFNS